MWLFSTPDIWPQCWLSSLLCPTPNQGCRFIFIYGSISRIVQRIWAKPDFMRGFYITCLSGYRYCGARGDHRVCRKGLWFSTLKAFCFQDIQNRHNMYSAYSLFSLKICACLRLTALDRKLCPWGFHPERGRISSFNSGHPANSTCFTSLRSAGKVFPLVLSPRQNSGVILVNSPLTTKFSKDRRWRCIFEELSLTGLGEKKKSNYRKILKRVLKCKYLSCIITM